MTDLELIQAIRHCYEGDNCKTCLYKPGSVECYQVYPTSVADRMEALLAENERLKAQLPKWKPASEPPTVYGRYLGVVKLKAIYGGSNICTCGYDSNGFSSGFDRNCEITHWMPLPKPCESPTGQKG